MMRLAMIVGWTVIKRLPESKVEGGEESANNALKCALVLPICPHVLAT
jgi:hypothetical protein